MLLFKQALSGGDSSLARKEWLAPRPGRFTIREKKFRCLGPGVGMDRPEKTPRTEVRTTDPQ
jgi:hypothetical protein